MQIKRLSHVSLSTRNLAAAERFYVGLLGFEIAHELREHALIRLRELSKHVVTRPLSQPAPPLR